MLWSFSVDHIENGEYLLFVVQGYSCRLSEANLLSWWTYWLPLHVCSLKLRLCTAQRHGVGNATFWFVPIYRVMLYIFVNRISEMVHAVDCESLMYFVWMTLSTDFQRNSNMCTMLCHYCYSSYCYGAVLSVPLLINWC